jgi:predicted nuclease with TOPRIM domain
MAPTEQPKVIKELEDVIEKNRELRAEINTLRETLARANSQIPNEFVPLAAMLQDLRVRLTTLEAQASRKGHTHKYKDTDGTIFQQTTDPDK